MALLGIIMLVSIFTVIYSLDKYYAETFALKHMLFIEKKSNDYSITNGKQKLEWVVNHYDNIPSLIKVIISKEAFRTLVQQLFDDAIGNI